MSLLSKQTISIFFLNSVLIISSLTLFSCEYSYLKDGREVIRVYNDGDQEGWVTIFNNSKNPWGIVNGFIVRLVNIKNPKYYVFLMPFTGASFNFKGEQFIACEQANRPGIPYDWINLYNRGELRFNPVDCSTAGVRVVRCYPFGSPGGQANRSPKLGLTTPEPSQTPAAGGGYEFGVFPTENALVVGGVPQISAQPQSLEGIPTELPKASHEVTERIERNVPPSAPAPGNK